jgi:hypothetical protein
MAQYGRFSEQDQLPDGVMAAGDDYILAEGYPLNFRKGNGPNQRKIVNV